MSNTNQNNRPTWIDSEAQKFIGKYILVGLTYVDSSENVTEQKQFHGIIKSASQKEGILISLKGAHEGTDWNLPPDYSNFKEADSGTYHLHSTNEDIENPYYTSMWVINSPKENSESET